MLEPEPPLLREWLFKPEFFALVILGLFELFVDVDVVKCGFYYTFLYSGMLFDVLLRSSSYFYGLRLRIDAIDCRLFLTAALFYKSRKSEF